MNLVQKIARKTIKVSFDLSVSVIEYFSNMSVYRRKVENLRSLHDGTLGREVARCLDKHNLTLVPRFESHDLKHVLLNYQMTPEDEIRMQAFMLGNRNYTLPSIIIFAFGAILLPELWGSFARDFRKGRNTLSIAEWSLTEHGHKNLAELQSLLVADSIQKQPISMKQLVKFGAISSIIAGVSGMIYCLPFLFSNQLEDLVGAGFPFVGGSILAMGGLIALAKNGAPGNTRNEGKAFDIGTSAQSANS